MGGADGVWSSVIDERTLSAGKMVIVGAVEIAEEEELRLMLIELQRGRGSEGGEVREGW